MKRYKISDEGWLQDDTIKIEPSSDFGDSIVPTYIVMHYSGSGSAKSTIDWLTRRDEIYLSTHVVIARDGHITQIVSFTSKAFHAGRSTWGGLSDMNKYSIGIELINWGRLQLDTSSSDVVSYTGEVVPDRNRTFQRHQSGKGNSVWWETYTPEQISSAIDVCISIGERYGIHEIVGHDDIAPDRKVDPGPAFDLFDFKIRVEDGIDYQAAGKTSLDTRRVFATVGELKTAFAEMLEQFTPNK